jgi:hypothetical protein
VIRVSVTYCVMIIVSRASCEASTVIASFELKPLNTDRLLKRREHWQQVLLDDSSYRQYP